MFKDRLEAGYLLSEKAKIPKNSVIFAIPRGGIPVAFAISKAKKVPFDVVVVRKLPIPWNPEAGFGAVALDGSKVLNPEIEVSNSVEMSVSKSVLKELERRNRVYRNGRPYRSLEGKVAVVVDDGFASGYTAVAAYKFLKKLPPDSIIAVAPVCPERTKKFLENYFDSVFCLKVSSDVPFAVASFYDDFHDLSDSEVLDFIRQLEKEGLLFK